MFVDNHFAYLQAFLEKEWTQEEWDQWLGNAWGGDLPEKTGTPDKLSYCDTLWTPDRLMPPASPAPEDTGETGASSSGDPSNSGDLVRDHFLRSLALDPQICLGESQAVRVYNILKENLKNLGMTLGVAEMKQQLQVGSPAEKTEALPTPAANPGNSTDEAHAPVADSGEHVKKGGGEPKTGDGEDVPNPHVPKHDGEVPKPDKDKEPTNGKGCSGSKAAAAEIRWGPITKNGIETFSQFFREEPVDPEAMDLQEFVDYAIITINGVEDIPAGVSKKVIEAIQYVQNLYYGWHVVDLEEIDSWLTYEWGPDLITNLCNEVYVFHNLNQLWPFELCNVFTPQGTLQPEQQGCPIQESPCALFALGLVATGC